MSKEVTTKVIIDRRLPKLSKEDKLNLTRIIVDTWDEEFPSFCGEGPDDSFNMYVSYVMAYGYSEKEVQAYARLHRIEIDPNISDDEDELDTGFGSLQLNTHIVDNLRKALEKR